MRYFMWNFVGRQNDIQGHGGFMNGNWVSGIDFIDDARVGPRDNMPDFMKNDPNPKCLLFSAACCLGWLDCFSSTTRAEKGKKDFAVTMLLFIFTGIAIIVYLNQYPDAAA